MLNSLLSRRSSKQQAQTAVGVSNQTGDNLPLAPTIQAMQAMDRLEALNLLIQSIQEERDIAADLLPEKTHFGSQFKR